MVQSAKREHEENGEVVTIIVVGEAKSRCLEIRFINGSNCHNVAVIEAISDRNTITIFIH